MIKEYRFLDSKEELAELCEDCDRPFVGTPNPKPSERSRCPDSGWIALSFLWHFDQSNVCSFRNERIVDFSGGQFPQIAGCRIEFLKGSIGQLQILTFFE